MESKNKTLDTKKCSNAVLVEFSAKYDVELNSQNKSKIIDVLKSILKSEPKEYLRYVKALIQMDQNVSAYWILLAEFCAMCGYKLSKVLVFKKCVKNATKYGKDAEIARFKYLLGLAYIDNMQLDKARSCISQSIEIKTDIKKERALDCISFYESLNVPKVKEFNTQVKKEGLLEAVDILAYVELAIKSRTPFSMIRLGDGEGNLLAKFGHESNLFVSDYYNRILQIMFGDSFSLFEQFGVEVKSKFLASLEGADVIGYCANFEKNLKNSKSLASDRVLAGQLSTVDYVRSKHFSQSFGLSTAVATHNPESISSLFSMLESENFLGLVTCHSILKEKIRKTFNIRSVVIHETPGESKTISDAKLRASHFPTVYKKIIDEISVPFVGAVYLVGAGLLGKVYCGEIKRQGGIAIDIGSVMDALAGIKTRGNERLNDVEFHQRWNIEKFTKGIKK